MSQARCNARRRRQAKNGYNHVAVLGRPIYKKKDKAASAARQAEVIRRERERLQRKGASKK